MTGLQKYAEPTYLRSKGHYAFISWPALWTMYINHHDMEPNKNTLGPKGQAKNVKAIEYLTQEECIPRQESLSLVI